jgi:hypothetical protein
MRKVEMMARLDFEPQYACPREERLPSDGASFARQRHAVRTGANLYAWSCLATALAAWWPWMLAFLARKLWYGQAPTGLASVLDAKWILASGLLFGLIAVGLGVASIVRGARAGTRGLVISIVGLVGTLPSLPVNGLMLLLFVVLDGRRMGC